MTNQIESLIKQLRDKGVEAERIMKIAENKVYGGSK